MQDHGHLAVIAPLQVRVAPKCFHLQVFTGHRRAPLARYFIGPLGSPFSVPYRAERAVLPIDRLQIDEALCLAFLSPGVRVASFGEFSFHRSLSLIAFASAVIVLFQSGIDLQSLLEQFLKLPCVLTLRPSVHLLTFSGQSVRETLEQ